MDNLENQLLSERNSFLQKELAAKNRELEIEAALERVRQVAMSMMKTDDLLNISKGLFSELKLLGFDELRNAIINTFFDHKSTFLDYDYSDFSGGNITELGYDSHPLLKKYLDQIQSSTDAFAEMIVEQNELEGWKENRKKYGKSYDPRLDNISALYYYFYSIGGGAIGISTFTSITDEKRDILKKFRNVFDLGYRRYIDIANAEAQAKEAKIQLALERVRARTMAMQHSDELKDVANLLFQQVHELGIPAWSCGFNIWEKDEKVCTGWMSTEGFLQPPFKIPLTESPTFIHFYESRQRGESFYSEEVSGQALTDHYNYMLALPDFAEIAATHFKAGFLLPTSQIHYVANFSHGNLIFIASTPVPEAKEIFIRFAKVFEQTYTRFLDLQKAEAQAREAQIELGLERVRARAMAMRNSEELKELIGTVFIELTKLDLVLTRCLIMIYDPKTNDSTWWMANSETPSDPIGLKVQYHGHAPYLAYIKAWHEKQLKWTYPLEGEIKKQWDDFLFVETELSHLPDFVIAGMKAPGKVYLNASFNTFGNLTLATLEPLSDEHFGIMLRFAKVFDLTYTRFNDLQKAEAQAREAQIELGLERVRARAMAMQKSDELADAAQLLYHEFGKLGINTFSCGYMFIDEQKQTQTAWVVLPDGSLLPNFIVFPLTGDLVLDSRYKAWQEKKPLHIFEIQGEVNKQHHKFLSSHVPSFVVENIFSKIPDRIIFHCANFSDGYLLILATEFFSPEEQQTIIRFAKVFEMTYTRFNDLKQAEAQAREAQIELALERVRAKAMAMQSSGELAELVDTLFTELTKVDLLLDRCIIMLYDAATNDSTWWIAAPESDALPISVFVKYHEYPPYLAYIDAWHKRILKWRYVLEGTTKKAWDNFIFSKTEMALLPTAVKDGMKSFEKIFLNVSFNNFGSLTASSVETLPEEQFEILLRFAKVFDSTYTRFNDLQKAEAQAREGQIQLALERVRSRTMAMQKSDELTEVAGLLFKQVNDLGIKTWTTGFNVWTDDNNYYEDYITSPQGGFVKPYVIDATQFPAFKEISDAKKRGEEFFVQFLEGEMLKETYLQLSKFGDEKQYEIMLKDGFKFPTHQFDHFVFGSKVSLMFITYEAVPEAHDIFKRLGKVFEQTYTRFLDLQKAEAQAREAKIEVALEKVRSRSLAMHKSDELNEVVLVVFEKLKELNVVTDGVALINLYTEGTKDIVQWMANPELMTTGKYNLPYFDHPIFNNSLEAKKSGKDFNVHTYSFEEKNSFFEYCFEHTDYKYFPDILKKKLLESEAYTHAVAFGKYSAIVVSTFHKKEFSPAAIETMKRFSRVFEQSYIRFLDLLTAEANTKEVVKQAALDRIRAEIASMRTVTDLDRITPLIWNELAVLGIPFIRCGVFIMDEKQEMIHTFLSTPDGKAIAAFHLPYKAPGNVSEIIEHWRKKEIYCDHWDEETFREFADQMEKQGGLSASKEYLNTMPGGGFYLHFVPFRQGMLYVGNTTSLSDTDKQLIQSIADAFSTAYARYEDFNKLEEAKKQVDKTLRELQSTQKQLIQSEKMASLGELTAGIAHEIQNPLNFVNNFSDLNKELLEELKEEIEKGDLDEAKSLANDVIENEEKINHHGKRADAIVKGMLQHSRKSSGQKEPTDINALADEYLRLSYHGLRAKDKTFNADFKTDLDESIGKINIIQQDIGRVLLNLFNNAFYAVNEKQKAESAKLNASYKPLVSVETKRLNDKIEIKITDNGNGIPQKILDKIYQPFFTTKPTGEGTGLGLSLSYDIIKAAGGEIKVETKEGEGTEFIINLS